MQEFDHVEKRKGAAAGWATQIVGALLCLAVSAIHVVDQGGVPGSKTPTYIAALYWVLEIVGVVTAVLLFAGRVRLGWFLAMGVAAGPIAGYALSRGPGLPDFRSDVGNWTEPLGLVSLAVEGALLFLSATCFLLGLRGPTRHMP
ncbi:hypothetical protein [Streptomyces decoyicus]|uniref:hypothetical protein n=1 Tax=Streptomyces decoyicus TaxID=249567 RepID=UPI0033A5715A